MLTIVGLSVEEVGGRMASIPPLALLLVTTTFFTVELLEYPRDSDVTGL